MTMKMRQPQPGIPATHEIRAIRVAVTGGLAILKFLL
jgi:hypothetical protein